MPFKAFIDYLQLEKKYSAHTITAYQNDLESFSLFISEEYEVSEGKEVNYSMIRS